MGHSESTPVLALPQFTDEDKPTWRGDINIAFADIDDAVANRYTKTEADAQFTPVTTSQINYDSSRMDSMVRGTGTNAFVRRMPNNEWEIGYQIGDRRLIVHKLSIYSAAPGGAVYQTLNQLQAVEARKCMTPRDDSTFTVTGAGWVSVSTARAYGGTYRRNTTAGQTVAFTSGLGATELGMIVGRINNAGYMKVSAVDNAAAAVTLNLLPTAQEEVDAGRLAATSLVANGGTLNPTDRVYNGYSTSTTYIDGYVPIVNGLDATKTYTVTIAVTGYKQAASTDTRVYISGWAANDETSATLNNNGLDPTIYTVEEQLSTTGTAFSANEYALFVNPAAGAPADKWETVGSVHGYERLMSLVVTVDGVLKDAMGTNEWYLARTVVIDRVSQIWHPHAATKIADAKVSYKSVGSDGLRVSHKITWAMAVKCSFAYTLMWPYTAAWTRGAFAGGTVDANVNLADGSRFNNPQSYAMIAWGPASGYAGYCSWDRDLVSGYTKAPNSRNQIEDRTGGTIKKLYVARTYNGDGDPIVDVANGEVWTGNRLYRIARMPGAEGVLARVS